jgi:hypothetical protein
MKKIVMLILISVFALFMSSLIYGVVRKIYKQNQMNEKIAFLPAFSYQTLEGGYFSSAEIDQGPILIVKFHPECDHCRYELSVILNSDLPDMVSKLLLISSDEPDTIRKFIAKIGFHDQKSIKILVDVDGSFKSIFGRDFVPSNYIYGRDLKLVKMLQGEVKLETLKKYILVHEQH